jgi:hypothetical protein
MVRDGRAYRETDVMPTDPLPAGPEPERRRRSREEWPPRLRRHEASEYLAIVHGVTTAAATLAKLAVIGGGPLYELWGRIPYYPTGGLDHWTRSRLSPRRSTSDRGNADPT